MIVKRASDVEQVEVAGCPGVTKQIVLGPADGSEEIVLRYFKVEKGSATPRHAHDFPHLVKIEAGQGVAVCADGTEKPLGAGDYVFVPANELHSFRNTGEKTFEFVCIVPGRGEPPGA
ncbi:MAG: cupin domain-containing protein [Thermoleophilia bacterium]|nr:cupin domain-containing protein [Thermoleophilia bacterium]